MIDYGLWKGPTYHGKSRRDFMLGALDNPLSMSATMWESGAQGAVESFGLGTVYREIVTPPPTVETDAPFSGTLGEALSGTSTIRAVKRTYQKLTGEEPSPVLTIEQQKASPYFRETVPTEEGMTDERMAALAMMEDTRQLRRFYAQKRPVAAFIGSFGGQALDPINYIPVAGPLVKAAAVGRLGHIAGGAIAGALDAATNTALFGVGTRGERAQYGDDVSWQAMVSEIAMAALIGSAFGTVSGILEGRADTRVKADAQVRLSTLKNVQQARVALNEAIGQMAMEGEVKLSPNAAARVQEMAATVAREPVAPPVAKAAGDVDRSWAGATDVGAQTVVTPTGLRVGVRSEIVDASTLVRASGELQPRDRSRAASDTQVADMAANLDPARLMYAPEADRGAPVVGPDGVIESGNGRVMALVRAAEQNPEKFEAYKQALRDAGFEVPDTGVPILVSRRTTDLTPEQRTQFVNDANTSAIARMSATETAQMDVGAMTGAVLDNFEGRRADRPVAEVQPLRGTGQADTQSTRGLAVDASPPRPDAPPVGRAEAEARVAKPDDLRAIAEQYRIDPETGAAPEDAEIAQLKAEGRLTEEDIAELEAADAAYQDGTAYGEALKAATACLI